MNNSLNDTDRNSLSEAKKNRKVYRKKLLQLKKQKAKSLNHLFNDLHETEF